MPEHRRHQAVLWLLGILSSIQGEGTAFVLQDPVDPNQNPEGLPTTNGAGTVPKSVRQHKVVYAVVSDCLSDCLWHRLELL